MKLSVYTVSLPEYDIEQSAALVKEMGYDAIEWRVDNTTGGGSVAAAYFQNLTEEQKYAYRYWTDNKATLNAQDIAAECVRAKKVCDELGLEICNLATSMKTDDQVLEATLAAAAAIGCPSIRGYMAKYDPAVPYAQQFAEYRSFLERCEPMLKKYGVKMLIETHHGMLISSASSAMRFLDGLDPHYYGLIYDPGNMVFEGYENYQLGFEMLGDYLAHVHVKNALLTPAGEDAHGSAKFAQSWVPLQKGSANLPELVKALVKVGYQGVLSVEDFSNEEPTREKLEHNIAYLKELIAEAEAQA